MKIAIEAQRIFRVNKHGMDFVALNLIRQLQKLDHKNQYTIFVAPGSDRCLSESPNFRIVELRMPSYPLWEQIALPWAVAKLKPDILHCTSNTAPLACRAKLVVTLHDVIFLEPQSASNASLYQKMGRIYRRLVVPRILSNCAKIITVSNFERGQILEILPELAPRLVAVYNGYNEYFTPQTDIASTLARYNLPGSYLLFLGNTDPKKNVTNVMKAYSEYLSLSKVRLPLVVADMGKEFMDNILYREQLEHISGKLIPVGYIANRDLPAILGGSAVFLYPSLRESFGIPILEAMATGTPVITSNISAMPEIAGPEGVLVDPRDSSQIAQQILRLEQEPEYRHHQIAYGLERAKLFSWSATAHSTLQIYEEIQSGS